MLSSKSLQNRTIFHLCWYEPQSVCNSEGPIHVCYPVLNTEARASRESLYQIACFFQWLCLSVNTKILTSPTGPRRLYSSSGTLTYFVLSSFHLQQTGLCCSPSLQAGSGAVCFLLPLPRVLFPETALSFTLSPPLHLRMSLLTETTSDASDASECDCLPCTFLPPDNCSHDVCPISFLGVWRTVSPPEYKFCKGLDLGLEEWLIGWLVGFLFFGFLGFFFMSCYLFLRMGN